MYHSLIKPLILFVIIFLPYSIFAINTAIQTDEQYSQQIIGSWSIDSYNSGEIFSFYENGRVRLDLSGDGLQIGNLSGSWSIQNGKLFMQFDSYQVEPNLARTLRAYGLSEADIIEIIAELNKFFQEVVHEGLIRTTIKLMTDNQFITDDKLGYPDDIINYYRVG